MKTISLALISLSFIALSYGQENTKDETLSITIKKTIVNNGDTTIVERSMQGEDARRFMERSGEMKKIRDERMHSDSHPTYRRPHHPNPHVHPTKEKHFEKVVIHRSGEKQGDEVVYEGGKENSEYEQRIIVRTQSDGQEDNEIEIELENGRLIIIRNGQKEVIDLDDVTNKIVEMEKTKNGEVKKRTIVIEEISDDNEREYHENPNHKPFNKPIKLEIIPNPNNGEFRMAYDLMEKGEAVLIIRDSAGKIVVEEKLEGEGMQKKQIDLRQFGAGVYVISLSQNDRSVSKKAIVE